MKRFFISLFITFIAIQGSAFSQIVANIAVSDTSLEKGRGKIKLKTFDDRRLKRAKIDSLIHLSRVRSKDAVRTKATAPGRVLSRIADFTHYTDNTEILGKLDTLSFKSEIEYKGMKIRDIPQNTNVINYSIVNGVMIYTNIWDSTNLWIEHVAEGKKETIIIKDAAAPDTFHFRIETKSVSLGQFKEFLVPPSGLDNDSVYVVVNWDATEVDSLATDSTHVFNFWLSPSLGARTAYPVSVDPTLILLDDDWVVQMAGTGLRSYDPIYSRIVNDSIAISVGYDGTNDEFNLIYSTFQMDGTVVFDDTIHVLLTTQTSDGNFDIALSGNYLFLAFTQSTGSELSVIGVILDPLNKEATYIGGATGYTEITTLSTSYLSMEPYKDNKAVLFFQDSDDSNQGKGAVLTMHTSSAAVTEGTSYTWHAANTLYIGSVQLAENKFVVGEAQGRGLWVAQIASNDSIYYGPEHTHTDVMESTNSNYFKLTENYVVLPNRLSGWQEFSLITVSNDTVTNSIAFDSISVKSMTSKRNQQHFASYSDSDSMFLWAAENVNGTLFTTVLVQWGLDGVFTFVDTTIKPTILSSNSTQSTSMVRRDHLVLQFAGDYRDDVGVSGIVVSPILIDNGVPFIHSIKAHNISYGTAELSFDTLLNGYSAYDSFVVYDANDAVMSDFLRADKWNDSLYHFIYDTLSLDSTARTITGTIAGFNDDTLRAKSFEFSFDLLPVKSGQLPDQSNLFASDQIGTGITIGAYDLSRANQTTGYQVDTTSLGSGGWGVLQDSVSLPYVWTGTPGPTTDQFYYFRIRARNIYGHKNPVYSPTFYGIKSSGGGGSTVTLLDSVYLATFDSLGNMIIKRINTIIEIIDTNSTTPGTVYYVPFTFPLNYLRSSETDYFPSAAFYRDEKTITEILDREFDGQYFINNRG